MASFDRGATSRSTISAGQVSLATGPRPQQALQADGAQQPQRGGNVSVRQTANDFPRSARDRRVARQAAPNRLDQVERQMGEIPERLMLDLAAIAIGASQEMRDIGLAISGNTNRGYVNRSISGRHAVIIALHADKSSAMRYFTGYIMHLRYGS